VGGESDKYSAQGGSPVEMLYKVDGARVKFDTKEMLSHTALIEFGFSARSALCMNGLVHS
jgi:hypothetical protein